MSCAHSYSKVLFQLLIPVSSDSEEKKMDDVTIQVCRIENVSTRISTLASILKNIALTAEIDTSCH